MFHFNFTQDFKNISQLNIFLFTEFFIVQKIFSTNIKTNKKLVIKI